MRFQSKSRRRPVERTTQRRERAYIFKDVSGCCFNGSVILNHLITTNIDTENNFQKIKFISELFAKC